jgi:hypothetical protein
MMLKVGHFGKYIRNMESISEIPESFEMWCRRRVEKIN